MEVKFEAANHLERREKPLIQNEEDHEYHHGPSRRRWRHTRLTIAIRGLKLGRGA